MEAIQKLDGVEIKSGSAKFDVEGRQTMIKNFLEVVSDTGQLLNRLSHDMEEPVIVRSPVEVHRYGAST